MPMLLDNSLKYLKVFNELKQQIKNLVGRDVGMSKGSSTSTKDIEEIRKTLSQLESNYISLV